LSISKFQENVMKIHQLAVACIAALTIAATAASAQQALKGSITKVDEANGKISIQLAPAGTVGASGAATAEDFKVQDGLMFNALQSGDKVTFTAKTINGAKTITQLEKESKRD
jgi:Cu/Ag efflux protein CusF